MSGVYGSMFPAESIKVIAESVGLKDFPDDAAQELANDISHKLKQIIHDGGKFMHHAKRQKLTTADIDHSLKVRNVQPQYGFNSKKFVPFRFASGGNRQLHFVEEKDVSLGDIISARAPKVPLEVSLHAHWLAIEGIQPTIPENPSPLSRQQQAQYSVQPKDMVGKPISFRMQKFKTAETVTVNKELAIHETSAEQQLYFQEITKACIGNDERSRVKALQSLSSDPGLHEILPRLSQFIVEGVRVNIAEENFVPLIYLMRMVKALSENESLYLENYLHELIPPVVSCIVSRSLCKPLEFDDHWALRDYAARLVAQFSKNFNTSTNSLQTRITRMFDSALQNDSTSLTSMYGAIKGLVKLGNEVIEIFIVPRLKYLSSRLELYVRNAAPTASAKSSKSAADNICKLLRTSCAPILKSIRHDPHIQAEYIRDYGFLGTSLQQAVLKIGNTSPQSSSIEKNTPINVGPIQNGKMETLLRPSILRVPAGVMSVHNTTRGIQNQSRNRQHAAGVSDIGVWRKPKIVVEKLVKPNDSLMIQQSVEIENTTFIVPDSDQ